MIYKNEDAQPVEMLPGLTRRTLVVGKTMMLCEFTFAANVEVPIHTHPHEQIGYVASGCMIMTIGEESITLGAGDSYYAPSNVPHGARTLEPTVAIDVFQPPREDYQ